MSSLQDRRRSRRVVALTTNDLILALSWSFAGLLLQATLIAFAHTGLPGTL